MPVTVISTTGAIRFGATRLLSRPVPVDEAYLTASSEPDEVIEAPRRANGTEGLRSGLLALLLFGLLQAAALGPTLLMARALPA